MRNALASSAPKSKLAVDSVNFFSVGRLVLFSFFMFEECGESERKSSFFREIYRKTLADSR